MTIVVRQAQFAMRASSNDTASPMAFAMRASSNDTASPMAFAEQCRTNGHGELNGFELTIA